MVTASGARSGAPNTPTPTKASPLRGGIEQAGESCTRWGRTATVCMTTEDKEHKSKKNPAEAEKKKTMKKTGSTAQASAARLRFCGPSPTKAEPSGLCLMPLDHYGCPVGEKELSDGQQVYMPNVAKMRQTTAKKCTKLTISHQNSTNFGQQECFSDILAGADHFEGL